HRLVAARGGGGLEDLGHEQHHRREAQDEGRPERGEVSGGQGGELHHGRAPTRVRSPSATGADGAARGGKGKALTRNKDSDAAAVVGRPNAARATKRSVEGASR